MLGKKKPAKEEKIHAARKKKSRGGQWLAVEHRRTNLKGSALTPGGLGKKKKTTKDGGEVSPVREKQGDGGWPVVFRGELMVWAGERRVKEKGKKGMPPKDGGTSRAAAE